MLVYALIELSIPYKFNENKNKREKNDRDRKKAKERPVTNYHSKYCFYDSERCHFICIINPHFGYGTIHLSVG